MGRFTDMGDTEDTGKYEKYVVEYSAFLKALPKGTPTHVVYDWVLKFVEDNDLMEEFLACKFNTSGLYAFCRYKNEGKTLDWLMNALKKLRDFEQKKTL